MKKYLLLCLVIIACSTSVKVDDVKQGKNLEKVTLTTPEFMAEKFIKKPKPIMPTRTQTNYYEILFEDDTYYYWGYLSLSLKLGRTVKLYKTERTQYNYVKENSYTISSWKIDSIIATNFKNNYPEFNYDSIKALNKCNFNLVKNSSEKYDVSVEGAVEFYHMKKVKYKNSNDSITKPVTLKTFNYKGIIEKGKTFKKYEF